MNSEAPFKIGEEVICVDDTDFISQVKGFSYPTKGNKYTIRDCFLHPGGWWAVLLMEVINPPFNWLRGFVEGSYKSSRFRRIEYKSATAEILEKFKPFEGVEVDQPVKIKEPALS